MLFLIKLITMSETIQKLYLRYIMMFATMKTSDVMNFTVGYLTYSGKGKMGRVVGRKTLMSCEMYVCMYIIIISIENILQ